MQAKNKNKDEKMKNTKILCKAAIVGGLLLGTGGLYAVEAPKISLKQSKNMMDMMVNVLSIVAVDRKSIVSGIFTIEMSTSLIFLGFLNISNECT